MIITTLVDASNFEQHAFKIASQIKAAAFTGIDVETQDDARHEGLNKLCKYDPITRKKSSAGKLVFDMQRTVMTGLSLFPEGSDEAYYINLNQADIQNRVPWEKVKLLLDVLPDQAHWIAHNAAYELTAFKSCYNYDLKRTICTMQMAVSAFGPDEYAREEFIAIGQGGIKALIPALMRGAMTYDPEQQKMSPELEQIVGKIIAKDSSAAHSYNGLVAEVSYSYGLKRLVKMFFRHKMTTFEEVLGDKAHMGQLTGADVAAYGAEDAYWALRLFRHLMMYMAANCPDTITTFFSQENPMVQSFSDIWVEGMRVNVDAVYARRDLERSNMAQVLRDMKSAVRQLLPFDTDLKPSLMGEAWYAKSGQRYRDAITAWANSADNDDDFAQCAQIRGPVSNAWAIELGKSEPTGPNFSHYMPVRVLLYDLLPAKVIRSDGKVQSDGEARGKVKDKLTEAGHIAIIDGLNKIAGVEQRMKLYLTPYTQLMDPDTGKLYSTVSSMLASRRMASANPNAMQLAKRGESTYVRGFFIADYDDHVIISIDWSAIELVEIGEFSGDPEFISAFGQIPHEDLHSGAAASILEVEVPGLNELIFRDLKLLKDKEEFLGLHGDFLGNTNRLFTDLKGQEMSYDKVHKYWRTEVGKGANFNYWYSGFLGTIGDRMGWSIEKTGEATDRYRSRFNVAEQWRVDLIAQGQRDGYITLPDGHRRVRFEATPLWAEYFLSKFQLENYSNDDLIRRYNALWSYIARKIQKRAYNQLVNSMIQGSCATIAKRSKLRVDEKMKSAGYTKREARFMMPIHDELLWSVHRDIAPEFINMARGTMIDHPDMFKLCKLDASPSVGLTFEPWNAKSSPLGQVELFELPNIGIGKVNSRVANDNEIAGVVDYLFDRRKLAA